MRVFMTDFDGLQVRGITRSSSDESRLLFRNRISLDRRVPIPNDTYPFHNGSSILGYWSRWPANQRRRRFSHRLLWTNLFEIFDGFAEGSDLAIAEATFSEHCPFEIDPGSLVLVIRIQTGLFDTFQFQNTFEQLDFTLRTARRIIFDLQIITVDIRRLRNLPRRIDLDGRATARDDHTWSLSCSMALNRSSSWISPWLASIIIVFVLGKRQYEAEYEDRACDCESVKDRQITGYHKQQMEK